jgi:hypothetical protein
MSHEVEVGRTLLAGFISGAIAAFASSIIVLVSISRSADWHIRAARVKRVSLPFLGVVLVNGLLLGWTLLGLVLGMIYVGIADPLRFGTAVSMVTLLALLAAGFICRRITAPMWGTALMAAVIFGVLFPALVG